MIADGNEVLIPGIMEHIERAGVHSGDSSAVYPPVTLTQAEIETITRYSIDIALALGVRGLLNAQYVITGDGVFLLEVMPRASRTVPFLSKATGVPIVHVAMQVMLGHTLAELGYPSGLWPVQPLFAVKTPVFSLSKLVGVEASLGPEMKSTGEVMGVGDTFGEAFAKAQLAAGQKLPTQGTVFLSVTEHDKRYVVDVARKFVDMGFKLVATSGTGDVIEAAGMKVERVYKVKEGRPNVVDLIKGQRIHLIVNTPTGLEPWFDEKAIRRAAVTARIPTITTLSAARAAAEGIAALQRGELNIRALQQLHAERTVGKS